jgi:cobalt-zinc-cadmium resistance protein CzcA
MHLPIDAVPDITNNQVQIITTAPAQPADEIERLVTFPVEQAIATIEGIIEMRSFSRFGLSVVTVVFKESHDIYRAREEINQRLAQVVDDIPAGAGRPTLAPISTGLGEIYQYVVRPMEGYEDDFDPMQLRSIQDWMVRRQLLGLEGVADVSGFGGFLKQYEVAIDPERLQSAGVSVADIFEALRSHNQNVGAAYIDKRPNAWFIRTEGRITSLDDIRSIPVAYTNTALPLTIGQVADVRFGHAVRYGALTYNAENDGEAVGGIVLMLKGANSSAVIENVKNRIAQIQQTLPKGVTIDPYLDRSKLVDSAIRTVGTNLIEGALIVIFVLVLLLGNFRAGLIVASVIPLAMLFAVAMMRQLGISGNLMSLGAIDFGLIVDGAVIIVEATVHHLGLRKINAPRSQKEMDAEVFTSATRIRTSAAFGEIIILIVYLPILALAGIEGKMFQPMAQTVSLAIAGAFILSLTYVPMMCALFLHRGYAPEWNLSRRLIAAVERIYAPALRFALQYKIIVLGVSVLGFVASIGMFWKMGSEFLPTLDEGDFAVEVRLMPGSSLEETIDVAQKTGRLLLEKFPEAKSCVGKIGSAEIPTDPMPIEACDLMVLLKDKSQWQSAKTREALADTMRKTLENAFPGVVFGFQQPIQMRFNELMTGARQDLVIKVYGEDLSLLSQYAQSIATIAHQTSGAADVYLEQTLGLPTLHIEFRRDDLARYGLTVEQANMAVSLAYAGAPAGMVYEGEQRYELVVRLAEDFRKTPETLGDLWLNTSDGRRVPLSAVADVALREGPVQIQRDNARRRVVVGINVRGRDMEGVVDELRNRITAEVPLEPGYYTTYGGAYQNLVDARRRLWVAAPLALLLILVLLYFTFGSLVQGMLIFTAIPLSAIGGIVALWWRDMPFSISAGVGFIALFGVAVLNGVVLMSEFNRLKHENPEGDIIQTGALRRLRPVLLTAAVASLGFLPMALSSGAGAEVQRPLATVVVGGLMSATFLTLFVLPVLYSFYLKFTTKK